MFDPVDPKQSFPNLEHGILQYWREEDVFKRSIKQHSIPGDVLDHQGASASQHDTFSFYDGPPFATGLPHYGHLLAGTIKDVIPRYQTMRGKKVERRFGWDCHGLPVENLVEKEQGLKSKKDIEAKGSRWFNDQCRISVQRYTEEWRKTVERMGRWVDMDWDYRTMDPEYMESIWWVFAELYRKGLIYEGHKAMHICPRCATPLSNFEVTLGYKDREDLSVIMTFPFVDDPKTLLLAWTTTPWSLPGNFWLAVGPAISYAKVRMGEMTYVLATKLVEKVFAGKEYERLGTMSAQELAGKRYQPLFPYFVDTVIPSTEKSGKIRTYGETVFKVVINNAVEVSDEEGTGIVHLTSATGEDSNAVATAEKVDVLPHVGIDGAFIAAVTDFVGLNAKPEGDDSMATDKKMIEYLKEHGRHFSHFTIHHSYPHCWRCDTPLLPYTTGSWFVAIERIKKDLLAQNAKTNFVPPHIRDGRFGEWLTNARDWAISRNRYWGTPLPIWRCEETGEIEVIRSRDALMAKCPSRFTKLTVLRHAESEGNLIPIYQGENPGTNLTEKGRGQAEVVGKRLAMSDKRLAPQSFLDRVLEWSFSKKLTAQHLPLNAPSVIYASPLARTRQTAEIIAKRTGAKVIIDERLREVRFGDWEGKTVDFSDLTFVKERRAHKIEKGKPESIYHFEGMETWKSVEERIQSFMDDVLPKHRGEHIAVVTHADPVINIKHFFTKEDPLKLSHQPYPEKAHPYSYFFDHERQAQLDLHKDTVDELTWRSPSGGTMRRITDVLDCWFESGSMPYAQSHYPFEFREAARGKRQAASDFDYCSPLTAHRSPLLPGFPADFIAEGLDQTRGWFYTLMVLSTALFKKPAFKNCIVNGIVLAEDGKKMSKRLKNYPEPDSIMEKFGADAMRFTLMASPAVRGENLRFSEKAVDETVRRVILPLWNAYSFFVLHANEAGWELPQGAVGEGHPLDSWIRAELQDLANRMTKQLDCYDLSATCAELYETLDALTNWYIRRSRRRFAGKEVFSSPARHCGSEQGSAERNRANREAALTTLHDVLLTFCKLLAPVCPFITDAVYLNLVPSNHGSIHLTEWPVTRELTREELMMIEKMRLLRTVVSLGMGLRAEANIKVRQPLQRIEVALPRHLETSSLSAEDQEILAHELNVKEIRFLADASHLADRIVQVDARKVGPRLGGKVQEIIKAAKAGEFTENADGAITVLGETLSKEEAPIIYRGKEGQLVASEKGIVVALDALLTDELTLEGVARDLIRSIQALRKDKDLKVADAIHLVAGEGTGAVLAAFKLLIEKETNGSFGEGEAVLRVCITVNGEEPSAHVA
ncbi:MAG TPA: class I tRNA ligase family protein [Candidatus Peribacterales bacterium]|nr:class I tRNA ligase family protein [Candidatus Peribacterales bacterium]